MALGITYSIIVSLLFSAYLIPRKFSKQDPFAYTVFMGISLIISSFLFYGIISAFRLAPQEPLFDTLHLLSSLNGILWAAGSVCMFVAIDKIGLSKSSQWKNLQGPIGAALMLIFLSDVTGVKIWFVVGGTVAMFVSALLFNIKQKDENKKIKLSAILLALAAAVCYGTFAFLQKILTGHGLVYTPVVYFAVFVFLAALIAYAVKYKNIKSIFKLDTNMLINPITNEKAPPTAHPNTLRGGGGARMLYPITAL